MHHFPKEFKGDCFGVRLVSGANGETRAGNTTADSDIPYIGIQFLCEDDGNWFEDHGGVYSAFWIVDILEQLRRAKKWLDANCNKDQWGWLDQPKGRKRKKAKT